MSGHVNAEHNTQAVELFWKALQEQDLELLDEICDADFRLVEPEIFAEPYRSLAEFRAEIAREAPGTFETLEVEPIGDALLVRSTWTPPVGELEHWRTMWTFWDGKICRIDGKRIGHDVAR